MTIEELLEKVTMEKVNDPKSVIHEMEDDWWEAQEAFEAELSEKHMFMFADAGLKRAVAVAFGLGFALANYNNNEGSEVATS